MAANKLRSTLTVLGVAISSLAITLLVLISSAVNQQITDIAEGLGSNLYVVLSGARKRRLRPWQPGHYSTASRGSMPNCPSSRAATA